jgi:hypothetical protein
LSLDTWPDFEFYPGPSAALDAALMREVDLSGFRYTGQVS